MAAPAPLDEAAIAAPTATMQHPQARSPAPVSAHFAADQLTPAPLPIEPQTRTAVTAGQGRQWTHGRAWQG